MGRVLGGERWRLGRRVRSLRRREVLKEIGDAERRGCAGQCRESRRASTVQTAWSVFLGACIDMRSEVVCSWGGGHWTLNSSVRTPGPFGFHQFGERPGCFSCLRFQVLSPWAVHCVLVPGLEQSERWGLQRHSARARMTQRAAGRVDPSFKLNFFKFAASHFRPRRRDSARPPDQPARDTLQEAQYEPDQGHPGSEPERDRKWHVSTLLPSPSVCSGKPNQFATAPQKPPGIPTTATQPSSTLVAFHTTCQKAMSSQYSPNMASPSG
jgi:hypothetical protein